MKKTLLAISIVLFAAAAFMLAGCDQPSFTSEPTTPIKAPVLEAEVLPGAVLLSWDPVADVQEYRIYRKAEADSLPIHLKSPDKAGYYVDQVDFGNSLKDGGSYTYTLEAMARGTSPLTGAISDPKTVTATIPARAPTIVTAPAAASVTVGSYVTNANGELPDMLEVYWETGKAELPLSYVVEYIYGGGEALPLKYVVTSSLEGDIYAKRTTFPLVGGASAVKITASWGESNYYAPASVTTSSYTGTITVLSLVTGLGISNSPINGYLSLSWNAVTGATGYDVYRAEITSGGGSLSGYLSDASSLKGAAIGAYSLITPSGGDPSMNGTKVNFTDTGYDNTKKWLYLVIAKNAGARSSAPALYVQNPSAPSISLSSSVSVSAFQDTAIGDDAWKVSVSWPRAEGETYALYRAPVEFKSEYDEMPVSVGAVTAIPAASLSEQDGKVIYIDKVEAGQLSLRQSYMYKVVVSKDGASDEISGVLKGVPFSKFISGSPSVLKGDSYGQFKVKPWEPTYHADLSYELYAAESDGTQLTSGWTQITGAADKDGYYTWSAPDTRKRYVFSQTTKAGSITLVNSNASTSVEYPYAPKLATSNLSPSLINQDANNVVISIGTALIQPPSPSANWWLENSSYKDLFGVNIYRSAEENSSTMMGKTPVTTVRFNNTNAAVTVYGVSVPAWSFYITLDKHNTIPATTAGVGTSETWYFGSEYDYDGVTYLYGSNSYTIARTSTTATSVTGVN
jgi:hypothetical protein